MAFRSWPEALEAGMWFLEAGMWLLDAGPRLLEVGLRPNIFMMGGMRELVMLSSEYILSGVMSLLCEVFGAI